MGANEILAVFCCIFRPFWIKLSTDDHINVLSASFLKASAVNTCHTVLCFAYRFRVNCTLFCVICMKSGAGDMLSLG